MPRLQGRNIVVHFNGNFHHLGKTFTCLAHSKLVVWFCIPREEDRHWKAGHLAWAFCLRHWHLTHPWGHPYLSHARHPPHAPHFLSGTFNLGSAVSSSPRHTVWGSPRAGTLVGGRRAWSMALLGDEAGAACSVVCWRRQPPSAVRGCCGGALGFLQTSVSSSSAGLFCRSLVPLDVALPMFSGKVTLRSQLNRRKGKDELWGIFLSTAWSVLSCAQMCMCVCGCLYVYTHFYRRLLCKHFMLKIQSPSVNVSEHGSGCAVLKEWDLCSDLDYNQKAQCPLCLPTEWMSPTPGMWKPTG